MTIAHIQVSALDQDRNPIKDRAKRDIVETLDTTTDVPAEALGQVCAAAMRRAWKMGPDGTQIVLLVEFS